ncbi:hypothetical protein [Vibrio vulnificus]|uniref:hypothetical protein n=1 Tax=Vibrio vulnificus TaxID=672 RepID=UPI0032422363
MKIERVEFNVLGCGLNTREAANNEKLVEVAHQRLNDWLTEQEDTVTLINIESIYKVSDKTEKALSTSLFLMLRLWYTTNK